jgi:hypothetical protein
MGRLIPAGTGVGDNRMEAVTDEPTEPRRPAAPGNGRGGRVKRYNFQWEDARFANAKLSARPIDMDAKRPRTRSLRIAERSASIDTKQNVP